TADTAGVIGALSGDPAAEARRLAEGLGGLRGRVGELLGQARKDKDVVRTLCLSDKLTQLEVAARTATEHGASLAEAVARHDGGQTAHLVAVLGVLGSRGESLAAEAMQCIGAEQGYAGGTVVTATIDPGLPPDDEDGSSFGRGPVAAPRPPDPSSTPAAAAPSELDALATRLRGELASRRIRIEGHPLDGDAEPRAAALARAEAVKRRLVERGVAAGRIEAVGRATAGRPGAAVRIVEVPDAASAPEPRAATAADAEPIGTSHFESEGTLSVASGHAAMLPILHAETEGDIVYYYDAETARGDDVFPFRALRLVNPSDAALESGPVAVFGADGFIGEGLCEPIPAHSAAFVPFARDRQIVVERRPSERDAIARLASFEGGVFSAELRHARATTFTLHNRSGERAVVYLRHTPAAGYAMADAPAAAERLGAAYLYRVEVEPRGRAELALEEATSVLSTVDLRAAAGATLLRAYVAESGSGAGPGPDAAFRTELGRLLAEATSLGELEQKATGRRLALGRERRRAAELREQLAFLVQPGKAQPAAVPAGKGPERGVGQGLGARLGALDAELARLTTELVDLQQEVRERRVRLEDDLAALRLEPAAPALGLR
ncbi:MAG: hypothetical protein IT373_17960, partial [Polyangiaceae bacterium]|nr:hypothetical protein [Polyangiaceae bacterium]